MSPPLILIKVLFAIFHQRLEDLYHQTIRKEKRNNSRLQEGWGLAAAKSSIGPMAGIRQEG